MTRRERRFQRQFDMLERSFPQGKSLLEALRSNRWRLLRIPMALILILGGGGVVSACPWGLDAAAWPSVAGGRRSCSARTDLILSDPSSENVSALAPKMAQLAAGWQVTRLVAKLLHPSGSAQP